jgi:hypothetical protein
MNGKNEIRITLNLEKETTRTKRYQEVGSHEVGYIYIQKHALAKLDNPDVIEMVITKKDV